MKAFSLLCLAILFVSFLSANFVEKLPYELPQLDGSILPVYITGDEYYRRIHDANDYTILNDPETGYAVYAVPDGNSIKVSPFRVGQTDPASLGIEPGLFKRDPAIEQRWKQQQANRDAGNRGSPVGTLINIVGFVRFANQSEFPTTPTYSTYNNQFNSTTQQSLKDYYDEVSNGQLTINSSLFPDPSGSYVVSMQVSHNRGYYLPYSATNTIGYTNDDQKWDRLWNLTVELIGLIDPYIPNTWDLDNDNDGIMDALTFIFRGLADSDSDLLWYTHWSWGSSLGTLNGSSITHYVFDFEGASPPLGASVICHEMGHMVGFPDLYHYSYDGFHPVAQWSLMATDNAQHELTHEKWRYGTWFASVPTITATSTPTQYTLDAIDQNPYSCYKIASNYATQYYMVEYRRDTGRYESGIPGSGLLVYRIIDSFAGEDVRGNADGPPDEVYIYRPDGDVDIDGTEGSANFSASVNRTRIHTGTNPEPWLYTNAGGQAAGNLCITDIGYSGDTTITFTLRDSPPNIWDGSSSTAWNLDANWSLNHIPTASEDVEIPSLLTRYPVVSTIQSCRSVLVRNGASLTVSYGSLHVGNDFSTYGILAMNNSAGNLYVGRDLFFQSGSSANITADAEIYVTSDVEFLAGSTVSMSYGYLDFSGTSGSYIRCYAPTTINHLRSHKTGASFGISAASTATLTVNGNFWTYDGSTSTHPETGTTIIKGSLYCYTGGLVNFASGTISFEGSSSSSIYFESSGNYLRHLRINKSAGVSVFLSAPAAATGTLNIQSGVFNAGAHTFTLGGDWINSAGPESFAEGTSRVIFNGSGHQYCDHSEDFYILEVNKSGGALRVNSSAAVVTCAQYDWTAGAVDVLVGTFTANDLIDNGLDGGWYLNAGGTINVYNPAPNEFIDLKGDLHIYGGTFNVHGGSTSSYWPYLSDASIEMSGGLLDFKDQGVYIYSPTYAFTASISGGTIRVARNFVVNRADYAPTGGLVEMVGSADGLVSHLAGSNLYSLKINKQGSREGEPALPEAHFDHEGNLIPVTRTNAVTATTDLDINGSFSLEAGIFNAPVAMNVAGSWTNSAGYDAFQAGTGAVTFDQEGGLQDVNGSTNFYDVTDAHTGQALRFLASNGVLGTLTATHIVTLHAGGTVNNLVNSVAAGILAFYNPFTYTAANYTGGGALRAFSSAHVVIADLTQNGLYGSFWADSAGHLEFHQDSSSWIDLNGDLTIHNNGIVDIYGGNMSCYIGYNGDSIFTLSSGEFNVKDYGMQIYDNGLTCEFAVSGGTIRANGHWNDNWGIFHPTGGTVELTGSADVTVQPHSSSWFWNLTVNKVPARDGGPLFESSHSGESTALTRSCSVTINPCTIKGSYYQQAANVVSMYGNLNCLNAGNVWIDAGIFSLNGFALATTGNVIIESTMHLPFGSSLLVSNGKSVTVNSGGFLLATGNTDTGAMISHNGTGYYQFSVEGGGTIGAIYTVFEYMNASGIQVKNGATVDTGFPFSFCTFRLGAAGGKLLWFDNSQPLVVSGAVFPANTWGGAYNVSKTSGAGMVYFAGWSGAFGGPAFEQDVYGRVWWEGSGVPPIENLSISYLPATNQILLNWSYPLTPTEFRVYRSTAPNGSFTQIATASGTSWAEIVTGNIYFYRVTAILP